VYYCCQSLSTRYGLKTQYYGFMNIILTSSDFGDFEVKLQHPVGFAGIPQVEERLSEQTTPWAKAVIKEQWFDGVLILHSNIEANRDCKLAVRCEYSCLLINFVLSGVLFAITHEKGEIDSIKADRYQCVNCTTLDITADIKPKQKLSMLSVCMTRHFVKYRFGECFIFSDKLSGSEKVSYATCNEPVTEQLKLIITEIISANQPKHIRRIYLEAKILEIIALHLNGNYAYQPNQSINTVNANDLPKLVLVKNLLEQSIESNHSLIEIARKVGLNDFKLKKGFKETYGYTVFGYLTEMRMSMAKELLMKGLSVSEVANAVGYRNPQHFTLVFKKRYNVLPSKIFQLR
jgi:AraC-like DNA-binding protein